MKTIYNLTLAILFATNIHAQVTEIWGASGQTIYKMDENGENLDSIYSFSSINPDYGGKGMTLASNGKLYGVASSGGDYNDGIIYEFNPSTNDYLIVHHFNGDLNQGSIPQELLLKAQNDKLYGITQGTGVDGRIILFEFDPIDYTFVIKHNFAIGSNEGIPDGQITQADDGLIYGWTTHYDTIRLFSLDVTTDEFLFRSEFVDDAWAGSPQSVMQGPDGDIYGLIYFEDVDNKGEIVKYDIEEDTLIHLQTFTQYTGGYAPKGSLIDGGNDMLYGILSNGGIYGKGGIFEYSISTNTITYKYDFRDGGVAMFTLQNDVMYGFVSDGGDVGMGQLISYEPGNDTIDIVCEFSNDSLGSYPYGNVTFVSEDEAYCLTSDGMNGSGGIVVIENKLEEHDISVVFNYSEFGLYPKTAFAYNSNGLLYGICGSGGTYGDGVVYSINPITYEVKKLADFERENTGNSPTWSFVEYDGVYYGLTYSGGTYNNGTLYSFDPTSNELTAKKHLDFKQNLYNSGSISIASNNKLYGTAQYGGDYERGVLYEYDFETNELNVKYNFTSDFYNPRGGFIQYDDGKMYGLSTGGSSAVLEYIPGENTVQVKCELEESETGKYPYSAFVLADNDKMYAVSTTGGDYGSGTLIEYTPGEDTVYAKYHFKGLIDGNGPRTTLMNASNGKLYGGGDKIGNSYISSIYEYTPEDDTIYFKYQFDNFGWNLKYGQFIEITYSADGSALSDQESNSKFTCYPNPFSDHLTLTSASISENSKIVVRNVLGQAINPEFSYENNAVSIAIDGDTGIYFIEITDDEGYSSVLKVLKK